jgi:hypothetical protein
MVCVRLSSHAKSLKSPEITIAQSNFVAKIGVPRQKLS